MSGAQSQIVQYLQSRGINPTNANIGSVLPALNTNPDLIPGLREQGLVAMEPVQSQGDPGFIGPPTAPQQQRPRANASTPQLRMPPPSITPDVSDRAALSEQGAPQSLASNIVTNTSPQKPQVPQAPAVTDDDAERARRKSGRAPTLKSQPTPTQPPMAPTLPNEDVIAQQRSGVAPGLRPGAGNRVDEADTSLSDAIDRAIEPATTPNEDVLAQQRSGVATIPRPPTPPLSGEPQVGSQPRPVAPPKPYSDRGGAPALPPQQASTDQPQISEGEKQAVVALMAALGIGGTGLLASRMLPGRTPPDDPLSTPITPNTTTIRAAPQQQQAPQQQAPQNTQSYSFTGTPRAEPQPQAAPAPAPTQAAPAVNMDEVVQQSERKPTQATEENRGARIPVKRSMPQRDTEPVVAVPPRSGPIDPASFATQQRVNPANFNNVTESKIQPMIGPQTRTDQMRALANALWQQIQRSKGGAGRGAAAVLPGLVAGGAASQALSTGGIGGPGGAPGLALEAMLYGSHGKQMRQ